MKIKLCCKCEIEKPIEEFYIRSKKKGYYMSICKICADIKNKLYKEQNKERLQEIKKREYAKNKQRYKDQIREKQYGLPRGGFDKMLHEQNGECYICGALHINEKKGLHLDHNHSTSKIRKLLCRKCNSILGYSNESINILKKCINYLEEHQ